MHVAAKAIAQRARPLSCTYTKLAAAASRHKISNGCRVVNKNCSKHCKTAGSTSNREREQPGASWPAHHDMQRLTCPMAAMNVSALSFHMQRVSVAVKTAEFKRVGGAHGGGSA
jgi:hypothetical protein